VTRDCRALAHLAATFAASAQISFISNIFFLLHTINHAQPPTIMSCCSDMFVRMNKKRRMKQKVCGMKQKSPWDGIVGQQMSRAGQKIQRAF
jgi:hypothetical protein